MRKWSLLVVLMLVFGLMGSMAAAEEPDSPVVVVDLPELEDMQPLYAEPSDTAQVLGEYARGTNAWLLGEADGFSHIRLGDGTEGYIPSDKALAMEPFTHLVKPILARQRQHWQDNVNLRIFRLYHHPLYTAPYGAVRPVHGESLTVLGQFGGWMHVRTANGQEGYIPSVELDMTQELKEGAVIGYGNGYLYVAQEDARQLTPLYAEPSEDSALLGEFYNGTQMESLGSLVNPDGTVNWVHVRIGELEGYVPIDCINGFYQKEEFMWSHG
ncbi:MAG: hypothetical protein LBN04_04405 [Oscillospiraceae bacterium]|nr:hypothetical protein [Oscillospiraceae bacterium]